MASQKTGTMGIGVFRLYTETERDQHIGALVTQWEKEKREISKINKNLPFVTVSRQFGSMALETCLRLEERLNQEFTPQPKWNVYDREIVQRISKDLHLDRLNALLSEGAKTRISEYMNAHFFGQPSMDQIFKASTRIVRSLCEKGHSIVIGRGGNLIASDLSMGLYVRIVAPFSWRVEQVASFYNLSFKEAEKRTLLIDSERAAFLKKYFSLDVFDSDLYDLILNQARLPMDVIVSLIIQTMRDKGLMS